MIISTRNQGSGSLKQENMSKETCNNCNNCGQCSKCCGKYCKCDVKKFKAK